MDCFGIAHDEQLAGDGTDLQPVRFGGVVGGQQQQDFGLERVGILEFVDEKVAEALLEVFPYRLLILNQISRANQQVHEVQLALPPLALVVLVHQAGHLFAKLGRQVGIGAAAEFLDPAEQFVAAVQEIFPADAPAVIARAFFRVAAQVAPELQHRSLERIRIVRCRALHHQSHRLETDIQVVGHAARARATAPPVREPCGAACRFLHRARTARGARRRGNRATPPAFCRRTAIVRGAGNRPRNRARRAGRRRGAIPATARRACVQAMLGKTVDTAARFPARSAPGRPDRRAPPRAARAEAARRRNEWCRWKLLPGVPEHPPARAASALAWRLRSSSSRRRSFSSPAALCVNVTAAILSMVVRPCCKHRDDSAHQRRGLAGACRRFDDQALVERLLDPAPRLGVGYCARGRAHAMPRISVSGSSRTS